MVCIHSYGRSAAGQSFEIQVVVQQWFEIDEILFISRAACTRWICAVPSWPPLWHKGTDNNRLIWHSYISHEETTALMCSV